MRGLLHEAYLDALAHVEAEATPGPWKVSLEIDGPLSGYPTTIRAGAGNRRVVSVGQTRPHIRGDECREAVANVAFIAAAREAMPRLLAENERLRTLLGFTRGGGNHDGAE
jgi:hypothetical protein